MSTTSEDHSVSQSNKMKKPENHKSYPRDAMPGSDLWTDGLICAFEFIHNRKRSVNTRVMSRQIGGESSVGQEQANGPSEATLLESHRSQLLESSPLPESRGGNENAPSFECEETHVDRGHHHALHMPVEGRWVPIGWARISELVQRVQPDAKWATLQLELMDEEDDITVADLAAPYWEHPAGPRWWCHVAAENPSVMAWLSNARWLHPAVSLALRDESRLISERMKHLLYEVPVRVAGGLLFELLGQSAGDPFVDEDDIPIVLRSWQAQKFLVTALHVKGKVSRVNVLGITEVQELLFAGGYTAPRTVHEVIAQLACRLTRWDDSCNGEAGADLVAKAFDWLRLFRKSIFGAADEIELKFVNRRNYEDMNLFSVILNQEIRKLSRQVIRVKWSLHAREEIVYELLQHLRGQVTRMLLKGVIKSTREMMEEQEAVRGRLFTIQDVMQSTVRAWLQDRSLRVTHNLAVFGGCGVVLTIITGLFGINVDGIPGATNTPYAFALFTGIVCFIGVVLIALGLLYLGLKKPITEEQVEVKKLELQELVKMFQHEAETHAQVRKSLHRNNLTPTTGDLFSDDIDYVLIQ